MNIITNLIDRIESYRKENKNPCKSYATKKAAERVVSKLALEVAQYHGCKNSAEYVVFFNESWKRWNAAINLNELVRRKEATGGYLGMCSDKGFYTF